MNKPILLVEDDENDVFFFMRAVKRLGIVNPVQVASDGQEAIDYMEGAGKFADRHQFPFPYLVLLDLKLPQVRGLDVLRRIREIHGPKPIVVILSSSRNAADVSCAYERGANAYLAKPASFDGLVKLIGSVTEFWLVHNVVADANL